MKDILLWGLNINTSTIATSSKENKKKLNRIKSEVFSNSGDQSLGMFKTSGQLGSKTDKWKTPFVLKPNKAFEKLAKNVLSVSCGATHTVIVTSVGLWTMGANEEGQLGREGPPFEPLPVSFEELEKMKDKIVAASCGAHHTIAITSKGFVFGFGWVN